MYNPFVFWLFVHHRESGFGLCMHAGHLSDGRRPHALVWHSKHARVLGIGINSVEIGMCLP